MSINEKVIGGYLHHRTVNDRGDAGPYNIRHHIGIELELENVSYNNSTTTIPEGWTTHEDGSLRNGIEYVTTEPMMGQGAATCIDNYYAARIEALPTARTSTHIHVNVTDVTIGDVRAMYAISYMMETGLFDAIGAPRKFCGYCMPLYEMNSVRVKNILVDGSLEEFLQAIQGPNNEKYYGFNVNSVSRHGTVEFRYFPGAPDKDTLLDWIDYCVSVKSAAMATTLEELRAMASETDLEQWLRHFFPKWADRLINSAGLPNMFGALMSILAVIPEERPIYQVQEKLVYMKPSLFNWMAKAYGFNEAQIEHGKKIIAEVPVVSQRECLNIMREVSVHRPASVPPHLPSPDDPVWDGLSNILRTSRPSLRPNLGREWTTYSADIFGSDEPSPEHPSSEF